MKRAVGSRGLGAWPGPGASRARRALTLCVAAPALLALVASLASPASAAIRNSADVASARAILALDVVHAGTAADAAVILKVEPGWHVNAHTPSLEYLIATVLALSAPAGLEIGEPAYPVPVERRFEFAGVNLRVYEGEVAIRFQVRAAAGTAPGARRAEGTVTVQACSDRLCLAPARLPVALDVTVAEPGAPIQPQYPEWFKVGGAGLAGAGGAGGASGSGSSSAAAGATPAGSMEPRPGGEIAGLLGRHGWWLTLGIIFLGGLALNLTPCVYPLIPITVSYFGAQAQGRAAATIRLALLYITGLAVTYSSLGVAAALTGGILGAWLQSPWVLGGLALVMVALALSCFGAFELQVPSAITSRLGSRRGVLGALLMGLTVGLVAAPCVGPFVIGLLAYVGATGNPWQGFWMFLSLSLGLGAPYLALAVFAGSIARLPRAGEWMEGVKHVFGLALLGMAVYFAAALLPRAAEPWALPGYLLAAALYLLIFERAASQVRGFRAFRLACAAGALAGALAIGWPAPPGIAWEAFSAQAVADARTSGLPVIIDFTADWCLPCKELDRITFRNARVVEAAREFVALKADVSEFTAPPIEALRRQYEIFGVPTVLFLDAQGREPRHLRVDGYLSPEEFHARMLEVAGSARPRAAPAGAGSR